MNVTDRSIVRVRDHVRSTPQRRVWDYWEHGTILVETGDEMVNARTLWRRRNRGAAFTSRARRSVQKNGAVLGPWLYAGTDGTQYSWRAGT